MSDLAAEYLLDLRLRGNATSTIKMKALLTHTWLAWCEARALDPCHAGREDFLSYLQVCRDKNLRTATLQKIFTNLASLYEFLGDSGKSQSAGEVRRIQKKYMHAYKPDSETRQIISVQQAAQMVAATFSTRDRAILLLLFKTGIRRNELASLNVEDVDLQDMSIRLKPTRKRTNRTVFFDHETADALRRWFIVRQAKDSALFVSSLHTRMSGDAIRYAVAAAAERVGLHTNGAPLEKRFGAHCCRHWFVTVLYQNGMRDRDIAWLRGDAPSGSMGTYVHINPEDVRRAYLACIPRLGV